MEHAVQQCLSLFGHAFLQGWKSLKDVQRSSENLEGL